MSFLHRSQPALRKLVLAQPASTSPSRLFTTTAVRNKSATEVVKDTVKSVDQAVSDVAVSGIKKGEMAAAKAKEVVGMKASEAKAKTDGLASEASGKATEMKHDIKGKAYKAEGKAKATAEEVKGKAKANM